MKCQQMLQASKVRGVPSWTGYEAVRYGITMPEEVPLKKQERADTTPIWYTP